MKRVWSFVLVLLALTVLGLSAQETNILKIKVQTANVRSEPDPNSAIIKQLKLGTLLESRQKIGDWYEVVITDEKGAAVSGYINVNVVDLISGEKKQEEVVKEPEVKKKPVLPVPREEAPVIGQASVAPSGGFKILGGIDSANLTYSFEGSEQADKYKKSLMSFLGGLGLEIGGRVGLELDFLYFKKGAKFKGTESGYNFDVSINIDEVSVPVMLKFHLFKGRGMPDVFLLGGGEAAYVLSNKVHYSVTDSAGQNTSDTQDEIKNTNRLDYGAVFGGGIELNLIGLRLVVEGRYHLGFANLSKADEELGSKSTGKTSAWILLGGLKF